MRLAIDVLYGDTPSIALVSVLADAGPMLLCLPRLRIVFKQENFWKIHVLWNATPVVIPETHFHTNILTAYHDFLLRRVFINQQERERAENKIIWQEKIKAQKQKYQALNEAISIVNNLQATHKN